MIKAEGCVLEFIWILVSGHMEGAYYHLRVGEVEIYLVSCRSIDFLMDTKKESYNVGRNWKKSSHSLLYLPRVLSMAMYIKPSRTFCIFSTPHVCRTGQSYLWGFCWSTNSCTRWIRLLCFCQYPGRCKSCPRYLFTIIFFHSGAQIKSFD